MRILFTGGGTGGHFYPILAIIRELKRIAYEERILDLELFYMAPDGFGEKLLREENVYIINVPSGKLRRYFSFSNFIDIFKTAAGIIKATWIMFFIMPDVVFSKGGYGALPAVAATALLRIPLIIHESDAVPGKVNLFAAKYAKRIGIAFAEAQEYFPESKTALVGIPIRRRILGGNREEAKHNLNIFSELPVIGFMGSSQGSQNINGAVLGILKELTDEYEILHQTGENNFEDVKNEASIILEFAHKERYHPYGFLNEDGMRDLYMASDIIISRASATSIFEIATWGKPSIIIPLHTAAQNHQHKNAYEYAASGACVVLEEENLTPHILLAEIKKLFSHPEKLKNMGASAQRFARIDSTEIITKEILKLGTKHE